MSQYRFIGALTDSLAQRIEDIVRNADPALIRDFPRMFKFSKITELMPFFNSCGDLSERPNLSQYEKEFPQLYRAYSRQLELIQSALFRDLPDTPSLRELSQLIDALRTYAEEAIIRTHRDPLGIAVEYLKHMRSDHDLALEMGSLTPEKRNNIPTGFKIREFDSTSLSPSLQTVEELENIYRSLCIDINVKAPQEGFLTPLSKQEIITELEKPGARLFVAYFKEQPIGFYLIFTKPGTFPSAAINAIKDETGSNIFPEPQDGWIRSVALSRDARNDFEQLDFSAYRAFTAAVTETARSLGIHRLWGRIRVGEQANTAREKHLAIGCKSTGIVYQQENHPFEIAIIHPFDFWHSNGEEIYNQGYSFTAQPDLLQSFGRAAPLYKDFDYCGFDSPEVPNFDSSRLKNMRNIRKSLRMKLGHTVQVTADMVDDCHEIHVDMRGHGYAFSEVVIRQKVPGKDLWKVEETDYYLLGNGKELMPLSAVLKNFQELRR